MRALIALIFLGLAAWRGYVDYQATMAQGADFAMTSLEALWAQWHPASYETFLPQWQAIETPFVWEPGGRVLMAAPAPVVFGVLAVFFWLIRRRITKPGSDGYAHDGTAMIE